METEQKEIPVPENETVQQGSPQPVEGVGALLRMQRERLGLSLEQITEKTRMRTHLVEAVENEAWDLLPPSAFVRGFIRSYAKLLGLNQDTVMDRYAKIRPPESSGFQVAPEPSKGGRKNTWLVLFIPVLLVAVYAVWQWNPASPPRPPADPVKKSREGGAVSPRAAVAPEPRPVQPAPEPRVKEESLPAPSASRDMISAGPAGESRAEDPVRQGEELLLTGTIKERTWLRIKIDGKEEKEYLFQPGARPQWKGEKSFYMLIGNAGGIEFDLNGKKVGNLGSRGQVIRLILPKDLEQR